MGESCTTLCQNHGGVDAAGLSRAGTESEGGSYANCRDVLAAFGQSSPVYSYRNDGLGPGCHVWYDGTPYYSGDPTPATDADLEMSVARIMCACTL